jgi:glycosyltransferase involved in cell wall biosynthesis
MPKISVIMSVFNGEKFLHSAIDSILNQSFRDFEFIIVNDGSTDNTLVILNLYALSDNRIIIINKENTGLSKSLNTGLSIAKGEYIARIDADDICLENRFLKQVKFLDTHSDYILVGSSVIYINEDDNFIGYSSPVITNKAIKKKLKKGNPIAHPSVMLRKTAIDAVNGYEENIKQTFEDFYLWHRIKNLGKFFTFSTPLIKYRITNNSISSNYTVEYGNASTEAAIRGGITKEDYERIIRLKMQHSKKTTKQRHFAKNLFQMKMISFIKTVIASF